MVTHMKTTIDIADGLLVQIKEQAAKESTTLKQLTEEGLQLLLRERAQRREGKVQPVIVGGDGLQQEYMGASWSQLRAAAYEGAGA